MNHDDENELFERLESEMTADEGSEVVDLNQARSARTKPTESAAPTPDDPEDPPTRPVVDKPGGSSGPGFMDRVRGAKRRPVLPAWALSKPEFVTAAGWLIGHTWHTAAYHGVRLPWYGLRLTAQSPRGAAEFISGSLRWVTDREGDPLRSAAARREDVEEYLKLSRQRDRRVRWRTLVAVVASVVGTATATYLYVLAPGWLLALSGGLVALALGWLGQPVDDPIVHRAVEIPKVQKLTSDIVLRALGALSIAQINQVIVKGNDPLTFTAPITRDGPGWRAEGDLPFGVTVADVVDKRDKLASGLRRPLGCVWPDAVPEEHTGRLVLWVGDQDMSKAKQPAWPLAKSGSVDLFKPVAFGTDQRGRWVEITLMYIAAVIGAIPRMGKTFLLRLLLLIAALDPRAELHLFDLKGTGDLGPLESVAYRYRAGDEDEDILYVLADLRELRGELRRRAKVIRSLPRDLCPESKVTSDLASKKSLGLHPIVVGVDECQVLFEHPKYGEEIKEICTDITKRGPALGFVQLLSTQRPDRDALPPGISANASARFCLKVMGQIENDMVLGTGAYKRGVRATMFAWADKGIHYFVGEGADARIVRSIYADAVIAERIALRGRKLREDAGTLAGHALGEEPQSDPGASYDLLADILTVVSAKEPKLWSDAVVSRLAELRPDVYGEWSAEQLTASLKPCGISTIQIGRRVDGKVVNRRGIARTDVVNAVAERDGKPDAA
ncbi:cell division protein FtsK [Streptomyces daqingensis]|uniref:Cell division protein FtsK n=1 Tax=Streptomyces daqingensis TaxID=1472640 RepID=A0ABQ2MUX6_9ACTN|nr:cell division protein FtsK [Streptomyces daqingensis]GGO58353.1 cell division protein FtsK [Streptomyces daqingensis]